MSTALRIPDLRDKIADLSRRIGILERRVREEPEFEQDYELIFSHAGVLDTTTSPKGYLPADRRLVNVLVSLGTAGTTTTTVLVKKNGSTIATINLGSGDTLERARASETFAGDSDALTVTISAAGTGAADLTVQARFS